MPVVVVLLVVIALVVALVARRGRVPSVGAIEPQSTAHGVAADAHRLQEQTAELEQQVETAQALAQELEATNAELSVTLTTMAASEERFRRMFTESPLSMWVYDPDSLAFLDVNAAAIQSYGYSREEFLGMTLRDIRPPEDVVPLLIALRTRSFLGQVVRGVHRHRTKDGAICEVELTAQDTLVDGQVARLVVVFNMTDHRRAAERDRFLAEASRLLSSSGITSALSDIAELAVDQLAEWCAIDVLEADVPREVAVACSDGAPRAYWEAQTATDGRRHPVPSDAWPGPASVAATGDSEFHPALSAAILGAWWPDAVALEERSLIVVPIAARGRRFGTLTLLSSPGRRFAEADCSVAEEIGRHAGLAIDSIERYAAEQAARRDAETSAARSARLQAVTAELSATLTAAAVARVIVHHGVAALGARAGSVSLVDESTRELVVQDAAGYDEARVEHFRRMSLDLALPLTDAVRTGEAVMLPTWDDCIARYPLLVAATPRQDNVTRGAVAALPLVVDGRRIGAFGVTFANEMAFDVAARGFLLAIAQQCAQALDRARLYEAEERARTAAEAANRAKSEFLATMSHELRTPLNAIAGFTQLLQDGLYGPLNEKQDGVMRRIDRAQRHLLGLINDVLNYAKLEAGRVQFDVRETDLAAVVADATTLGEAQLATKQIALTVVDCSDVLPDEQLAVWADADKLRQVLLNLLSNATKFTAPGGRVLVECVLSGDDDDGALIRVTDTGIGIAEEKLEAVFEPFVQVDASRTREHQGTGLGLAISRDLARGMGGDLTVTSVPGEGSTFTLTLRRVVTASGSHTDRRAREDRRTAERRRRSSRRGQDAT